MSDPFEQRQNETGLVYSCPIAPGECEGVRGDLNSYINDENRTNNFIPATSGINLRTFAPPDELCEGRLFDQARMLKNCVYICIHVQ